MNGYLVLCPQKDVVDFVKTKFIGICVGELNWRPSDIECMVFAARILWYHQLSFITFRVFDSLRLLLLLFPVSSEDPKYCEPVFNMVEKDLVNYSAPQVRAQSVKLLRVVIESKSGLPVKKLFSPLATLSADHEQWALFLCFPLGKL